MSAPSVRMFLAVVVAALAAGGVPLARAQGVCDVNVAVRRIADLFNAGPGASSAFYWGDVSSFCGTQTDSYDCNAKLYSYVTQRALKLRVFNLSQFTYDPNSCTCINYGGLTPAVQLTMQFSVYPPTVGTWGFVLSHVQSALQSYATAFRCSFPGNASAASVAATVVQSSISSLPARTPLCLSPFTDCDRFMPLYRYTMSAIADDFGVGNFNNLIYNLFNGRIAEWVVDPNFLAAFMGLKTSFTKGGRYTSVLLVHAAHVVALLLHSVWNSAARWAPQSRFEGPFRIAAATARTLSAAQTRRIHHIVESAGSARAARPQGTGGTRVAAAAAVDPFACAAKELGAACGSMKGVADLLTSAAVATSVFVPGAIPPTWEQSVASLVGTGCTGTPGECLQAVLTVAASGSTVGLITPDIPLVLGATSVEGALGGIKLSNGILLAVRSALSTCLAVTPFLCPSPPLPPPPARPRPPRTSAPSPPPPAPLPYPACLTCTVPSVGFSYGMWS